MRLPITSSRGNCLDVVHRYILVEVLRPFSIILMWGLSYLITGNEGIVLQCFTNIVNLDNGACSWI